jgi:hypothetical protein
MPGDGLPTVEKIADSADSTMAFHIGAVCFFGALIDGLIAGSLYSRPLNQTSELVLAGFFGLLAGQAGLASQWLACGPQPWWVRLVVTSVMACVVAGALLMAVVRGEDARGAWHTLLVVPTVWLVYQSPMMLYRVAGWRIVRSGQMFKLLAATTGQFSVRDLVALTAIVAIHLGLIKASLHPDVPWDEAVPVLGIVLVAGVYNVVIAWACLWIGLRSREPFGCTMTLVVVAAFALFLLAAPAGMEGVLAVILFHTVAILEAMVVLFVARALGYRIARIRRRRPFPST